MGLSVAPVARFGGLDLASSPDESGCIDALNVDLDVRGAVRTRDGYDNFTSPALSNRADELMPYYRTSATQALVAGVGAGLELVGWSGLGGGRYTTGVTASGFRFARFGTSNAERVYCGNGTDTLVQLDATTFSRPTATVDGVAGRDLPKAGALAVDSDSNRLVAAGYLTTTGGPNGATSSPSHVYFSEPGDPLTWDTSNAIQLRPGDGEHIMGLVGWRGLVFAFKQSAFFVFYGEGTDATGGAVFDYRPVDAGVGLSAKRAVAAGPDGVYFLHHTGVYKTSGGVPQRISAPIDPIFLGGASSFYQGGELYQPNISLATMCFCRNRLYLSIPTGSSSYNDRTLVYDPDTGQWVIWDLAASGLASFDSVNSTGGQELHFSYATGSNHIGRVSEEFTTDDGTAITSRYRTGFTDLGKPGQQKDVSGTRLWGTGTVAVKVSKDFGSLGDATNVTLGTAPAITAGLHNVQKEGVLISNEFSSVSGGAWRLHRYERLVADVRPADEYSD